MNPFAITSSLHQTSSFQIREMPRDLRLPLPEDLHEKADAHLPAAQKIDDAQPGPVSHGGEERHEVGHARSIHARARISKNTEHGTRNAERNGRRVGGRSVFRVPRSVFPDMIPS